MSLGIRSPLMRVQDMLVSSPIRRLSQAFSQAASEAAMNSASVVEMAVEF